MQRRGQDVLYVFFLSYPFPLKMGAVMVPTSHSTSVRYLFHPTMLLKPPFHSRFPTPVDVLSLSFAADALGSR